ncbi:hypothetical protein FRC01_000441 [Tulasnella sp. 417]|nr:hypothetical protein FRC01_000441 [Tulasnella sp. 417]
MSASAILKKAFPLIPTHGFTRTCIAEASALSDTAITALFGRDEEAERVLVSAWLKEGVESIGGGAEPPTSPPPPAAFHAQLKGSLGRRLKYNEPVLKHLPEAFAVLGTQTTVIPYDPRPAFEHAFRIADEALQVSGDTSLGPQWYARRTAVALAYSAAALLTLLHTMFKSILLAFALSATVFASPLALLEARDGKGSQTSLTLDKSQIGANIAKNGQAGGNNEAGQVASATSKNNFINFCATTDKPITNGQQVADGSCNPIIMGVIVGKNKMPSATFQSPKNLATITPNKDFTVKLAIKNMQTGAFVNPQTNYFGAPQQVNDNGVVIGHSHVVIQAINGLDDTAVLDNQKFAFFKGLNAKAENGILSATVTGGLPTGTYRMCTINTAANHQPVLVGVAQHGSLDACSYFTVKSGGNNNNGKNGKD